MAKGLTHIRLLNTRPDGQNSELTNKITQMGGVSINFPLLTIQSIPFTYDFSNHHSKQFDTAIFISTNAVKFFFEKYPTANWKKVYALGDATAQSLAEKNIKAIIPNTPDSEHLLQIISSSQESPSTKKSNILIIKGVGGRNLLQETLSRNGSYVECLDVYQRIPPSTTPQQLRQCLDTHAINTILFTSQQAIEIMLNLLGAPGIKWLSQQTILVISHRLAKVAQSYGLTNIYVTTYSELIHTLQGLRHESSTTTK